MMPLHLIRQLHFCPRIVYYYMLTDIKPVYPRHVKFGETYHQEQDALIRHRRFKKLNIDYEKIIRFEYIEDETLGIAGEVDLGFIGSEAIPVEYKQIKNAKPSYGHILQLCGYGLLMQSRYKRPFKRGYIIYGNNVKFFPVRITDTIRQDFFRSLEEIKDILRKGILPKSSASEYQCAQCEFLNFCDDRF